MVVLDGYIQSVLVFKTQRSTNELRTGYAALAVPHTLYRYHHQFQHKLSMGIHSPCYCCCCLPSETYGRNRATPIFRSFHNCQFHHRRLESLEHLMLYIYIYHSEHYSLIFEDTILFLHVSSFFLCVYISIFFRKYTACVLCI